MPFQKKQTMECIPTAERQINYLFCTWTGCFHPNQHCCASRGDEKNKSHIPNATVRAQQRLHKLWFHLVSPTSLLWRVFSTNTPCMVIPHKNLKRSQYFGPFKGFFSWQDSKDMDLSSRKVYNSSCSFCIHIQNGIIIAHLYYNSCQWGVFTIFSQLYVLMKWEDSCWAIWLWEQ